MDTMPSTPSRRIRRRIAAGSSVLLVAVVAALHRPSDAFAPTPSLSPLSAAASSTAWTARSRPSPTSLCSYVAGLSADFGEMWAGGERYEMVYLPDSMVSTTVFVGNLDEFVNDGMLSELFCCVSALKSVPAVVARKPNASSRGYGFVTFPNSEEKEAAIIRLSGFELNGRKIKVEPIIDKPGQNRVRVPGKLVAYAVGHSKVLRTVTHGTATLSGNDIPNPTRIRPSSQGGRNGGRNGSGSGRSSAARPAGNSRRQLPNTSGRGGGRGKPGKGGADALADARRLPEGDWREFERSVRRGYVTLDGTGFRRGRSRSVLATVHRRWCDERSKPQIVLCKASGGRPLDNVIVDLSPLRLGALCSESSPEVAAGISVDEFLLRWKAEILLAAERAGMDLRTEYKEDNTVDIDIVDDEEEARTKFVVTIDSDSWATQPIGRLPSISMGVFEGERSRAKAMARELAMLWDIEDCLPPEEFSSRRAQNEAKRKKGGSPDRKSGGRSRTKGLREHRRASRNKDTHW